MYVSIAGTPAPKELYTIVGEEKTGVGAALFGAGNCRRFLPVPYPIAIRRSAQWRWARAVHPIVTLFNRADARHTSPPHSPQAI